MPAEVPCSPIAVFDLGGTSFRSGLYDPSRELLECERTPAINYLSRPALSAAELQAALVDFVLQRVAALEQRQKIEIQVSSIALGAPINAHSGTVLGSGPLWGPTARPMQLEARLSAAKPSLRWHVVNDVTALLAPYMHDGTSYRKTMLITVSSGIGSRIYDHTAHRIPYCPTHGVQGEIGHLTVSFDLDGQPLHQRCECGEWDHMNAYASGRGIAQTLRELPSLSAHYGDLSGATPAQWQAASDEDRLSHFKAELLRANDHAIRLLDAFALPVARALATALVLDPDLDRIVITGGVARGLGTLYREALERTFLREGLYQITEFSPGYLAARLYWDESDDFAGLRGAAVHALTHSRSMQ